MSPCSHLSPPAPEKLGSALHPSLLSAREDWGLRSQNCCPKATPSAGPRRRCQPGRAGSSQPGWELGKKPRLRSPGLAAVPLMQPAPRGLLPSSSRSKSPGGAVMATGTWRCPLTSPLRCRSIAGRPGESRAPALTHWEDRGWGTPGPLRDCGSRCGRGPLAAAAATQVRDDGTRFVLL